MEYLELQKNGYIGANTENIICNIKAGAQKFFFRDCSPVLRENEIIGLSLRTGDGNLTSSTGDTLLTKSQLSGAKLHIESGNKKAVDIDILVFDVSNKPIIYVPITPFKNFNYNQSYIIFPNNINLNGVVELIAITAI